MPRKRTHRDTKSVSSFISFLFAIFEGIITLLFNALYGAYLLLKSIITRRPIEKHSLAQRKEYKRNFAGVVIIIGVVVAIAYLFNPYISVPIGTIVSLILLVFLIRYLRRRQKLRTITDEIDKHIYRALEIMDSTAKWYNSENEANMELVSCLRLQNIDATYQYRLPNGRTVDARVGNVLIEGKLSPSTDEVDRLLGQLSDYTQYGDKVNVVIYGRLSKDARSRIENEIHIKYTGKVFLNCLNNPRRQRAPSAM